MSIESRIFSKESAIKTALTASAILASAVVGNEIVHRRQAAREKKISEAIELRKIESMNSGNSGFDFSQKGY